MSEFLKGQTVKIKTNGGIGDRRCGIITEDWPQEIPCFVKITLIGERCEEPYIFEALPEQVEKL